MAKYEYTGDGTVSIDVVGVVSPGDIVEAPTSLGLGKRGDFKTAASAKDEDVLLVVEEAVVQPDQTPKDDEAVVVASEPPVAVPATTTEGK